jgi:hypothetical protein
METMTRSQFDALNSHQRMEHIRKGGSLVNDATAPPNYVKAGEVSRTAFDAMQPSARMALVKSGTVIVDSIDVPAGPHEVPFPTKAPATGYKWQRFGHGMFVQVPDGKPGE